MPSKNLRNYRTSTHCVLFPIQRLCPYIISEILGWCSPADLVIIGGLSKNFKAFLDSKPHGSLCWKCARANIADLPPPPSLSDYNLNEHAYAAFLFNASQKPCICCGQPTNGKFLVIMYRVYLCDRVSCAKQFESEDRGYVFSYYQDKGCTRIYAPILPVLPYNLPSGRKLFIVRHAKQELKEYRRVTAASEKEVRDEQRHLKRIRRHHLNNHSAVLYTWMARHRKHASRCAKTKQRILESGSAGREPQSSSYPRITDCAPNAQCIQ
ncbi:uncharacterized protein EV420DRAFT_369447 [Desarmillaria tabescens]|uniref:F-box domain-containing protein n=1 Tax=Armillaria tabescens TaxID=1929756 RepID=A0AA39KEY5_ARMTA|nr:uncharacterized protein EV420DRAFT_369447 [Desarmillaria tabescens]KAK0458651.1 hypothetical protein EV420DRAFT_369447 [Desarmillaria tabescens]